MKQKKNAKNDQAEKQEELPKKLTLDMNQLLELETNLLTSFNHIETALRNNITHDQEIKLSSTVECIKNYFDELINKCKILDEVDLSIQEQLYHIIYNISLLFYEFAHKMRKHKYSIHATKYLLWIITHIESNVVLNSVKYLKWRVKLYMELMFVYEDYGACAEAFKVVTQALNKLNDLKEALDQRYQRLNGSSKGLPDYDKQVFVDNVTVLKYLEFKYGILSGTFTFDVWKKKLDETFNAEEDKLKRNICMINSISNLSWFNSIVKHKGMELAWKQQAVTYCYDMLKEDIEAIKNGIVDFIQGKKREYEERKYLEAHPPQQVPEGEQQQNEDDNNEDANANNKKDTTTTTTKQVKKDNKKDTTANNKKQQGKKDAKAKDEDDDENKPKLPVEKTFKAQSANVPLEVHIELLKACYDCKMWKEFIELNDSIQVRLKYRNVELPYVVDIDIQLSQVPNNPPPKYYEKIELDLNVNNYQRELKRLRDEGKLPPEEKEEEQPPDPKAKKGTNAQQSQNKNKKAPNKGKDVEEEKPKDKPYEPIEGMEHNFVYLLIKRSHNPNKALTNVRVKMSNEIKIKSELKQNERAIALPIKTFKDNLYEQTETFNPDSDVNKNDFTANLLSKSTKMLPYIIIKKNMNGLETDKEKKSAVVDILPIISHSPYAEAPMNYKKIFPEVSIPGKANDPHYVDYNFDHNYVHFCYKNDTYFYLIERECELLRNLYELEISYNDTTSTSATGNANTKDNKDKTGDNDTSTANASKNAEAFLELKYTYDKLDILSTWLFNAIQGELGNMFLKLRSNFLYDICVLLWNKYLKPFLDRIEYFYTSQNELEDNLKDNISKIILSLQNSIFNTLYCVHYVLTQIKHKDVIIYAYLTSRLADYSERTGNNVTGVLTVQNTLDYIDSVKEDENIFGVNNMENKHAFTCFTCDNNKIHTLTTDINAKFDAYVKQLNLKRRVNYKKLLYDNQNKVGGVNKGIKKSTKDEIAEEDFETNYIETQYIDKLSSSSDDTQMYNANTVYVNDVNKKETIAINYAVTEYENTLNCIYVDLIVKMFRMYIKSGDAVLNKYDYSDVSLPDNLKRKSTNDDEFKVTSSGYNVKISDRTLKKLDIIKGKSAQEVLANRQFLKSSLQEAGKLEPDKPRLTRSEKIMQFCLSKNTYLNALFQSALAFSRSKKKQDQIYLLRLASNYLDNSFTEENNRMKYYRDNFFYVKSFERLNTNKQQYQYTYYPYNILHKPIMIDNVEKAPEPVLLHKTSRTCTFMFPRYKIKNDELDKVYHNITKVALYGQISTGVNCVQLNNKSLKNTGEIVPIVNYITVPQLKKNEKYVFAYAGYDNDDTIVNTIGKTSQEVELYFPLPLYYISFHICKIAFDFGHHGICKDKAKVVFNAFTEKSEMKDTKLDNKNNSVHFYKLKHDNIKRTCLFELEGVAYCFYYYAKSSQLFKKEDYVVNASTNVYNKQKNVLKCINIYTLGLDIAIYIRHYQLIKMFVCELYNTSVPFMTNANVYKELLPVYMKMHFGLSVIPNAYWNNHLRQLSSLVIYNVFVISNSVNEVDLVRKSLVMDLGVNKRKYYTFAYKYMQKAEEDAKAVAAKGKKEKKTPKTPKDKAVPSETNEDEVKDKLIEVTATALKDIERECIEIDECILLSGDYNDIMKNKLNGYVSVLDKYTKEYNVEMYPDIQNEIENRKKDINDVIEVYDGFKNEGIKYLQRFITSSKDKAKYYEHTTKMLKKVIEDFIASISGVNFTQYTLNAGNSDAKKTGGSTISNNALLAVFPDILKLVDDIEVKEEDIGFIKNIFNQKITFLNGDILYKMKTRIRNYLDQIKEEMAGKADTQEIDLDKMGNEIEEKFFGCIVDNEILPPYASVDSTLNENDVIGIKEKLYWIGELLYNKAIVLYVEFLNVQPNHQSLLNYDFNNFLNYKLCDLNKINSYADKIRKERNALEQLQLLQSQAQNEGDATEQQQQQPSSQPSSSSNEKALLADIDDLKLLQVRSGLYTVPEKLPPKPEEEGDDPQNTKDKKGAAKAAPKKGKDGKDVKSGSAADDTTQQDPFDNHIERNYLLRHQKLEKLLEKLALASIIMKEVNNYNNFDNLLSFVYNTILYDMLTPFDCSNNNSNTWLYLNIICETALYRLSKAKSGVHNYTPFNLQNELLALKNRISFHQYESKPTTFNTLNKSSDTSSSHFDNEKCIDEYESRINLDVYVEFICFVMQCTYYKQKWSILSNLIQNFNELTNDIFAEFTLNFLIEAQNHIYEKAHLNTQNKQTELNERVEVYETWKNSRKKSKRQQLITGEIPIEQTEFERDYSILSKQLYIFKSLSEMLRNDKEKSDNLYTAHLNDANNALKSVNQCRKKYEEYQVELMSMKKYAYNYSVNYKEYISKDKAMKYLTNSMLTSYKNCIRLLKKRQENYLLIQILYEMSIVMYSINDTKNAEVYFNEALDTVFQKLYSVKDFRNIFAVGQNATEKYGIRHLLYAVMILHKMCKYCYDNNLYLQRESALMASEIVFNVLNNVIPHPNLMSQYGTFRLNDIHMNHNIFKASDNIKVSDLLLSCIEMVDVLIAYGDYENCLPLLCLAEYLACDVCKNTHYTLKSRVLKIVCLCEIGLINESIMVYNKVMKKYDMPTYLRYGYKEFAYGKYATVANDIVYYNDLPPDDSKNIDAINNMLKLTADNELKVMLGGNLYVELCYMKLCILFKVFNKDDYKVYPDKTAFVDMRSEMLIRIEKEAKDNIITLSAYEDLCYLNNIYKHIKMQMNLEPTMLNVYNDIIKDKIDEALTRGKLTSDEMNNFVLLTFNKSDIDLSKERYELIYKHRLLLSKVFTCQGLTLTASSVLIKALDNLAKLSTSSTKLLNFDNADYFTLDFKTGANDNKDAKKGVKAEPPKAAPLKKEAAKKKGDTKGTSEEQLPQVNPEEEFMKIQQMVMNVYRNKRIIPNSVYWFMLHYLNLVSYFKMGRYDDCMKIISRLCDNSKKVNDVFFNVRCKEIEVIIHIQNCDIDKAKQSYSAIMEIGGNAFINEYQICYFYANYAEYLFKVNDYDNAMTMLKTARTIIWEKMAKTNYLIEHQNRFSDNLLSGLLINKALNAQIKDKESTYSTGGAQAKKTEQPKKGASSGTDIEVIDYFDTTPQMDNDYENVKAPALSSPGPNIYSPYIDLICKIEIKYALFNVMIDNQMLNTKLISSVLNDLAIMVNKQLYSHTYYNIIINYIYGMLAKAKFVEDIRVFLQDKFYANLKLLKRNNIELLTINKEILFMFSAYYNENVITKWTPLLQEAKTRFEKALTLAKSEFYLFENSFSVLDIVSELADVNMLLAEYQPNNKFKYVNLIQTITKIKKLIQTQKFYDDEDDELYLLNDDDIKEDSNEMNIKNERDAFINEKNARENTLRINYLKAYTYYCDLYNKISIIKRYLNDNISELASGSNLVDPSKLSRDITLQILESDYLIKKKNIAILNENLIAIKPSVDVFDVLNMLKNYIRENEYFTFNTYTDSNIDENMKNITKVHRFLKTNHANYMQKCSLEYNIYEHNETLTSEDNISGVGQVYLTYIMCGYETINHVSGLNDINNSALGIGDESEDSGDEGEGSSKEKNNKRVNLVYLLGPAKKEGDANGDDNSNSNSNSVIYGRIMMKESFVKEMNVKIYNLKLNVSKSMLMSEEKKQRDFKYYQIEYYKLIYVLIKEMLNGKRKYNDMKGVKEDFTDDDIGTVSIDVLDFWFNFLNCNTYMTTNEKYNALLRKIHMKLLS